MSELASQMKADAREAQKFSRKHLVLELDFSPQSLGELERHCDALEYAIRGGKSPENIQMLTRIWGAYLGETLRIQLGGEWVEGTGDVASLPVIRLGDEVLHPHEQVRQRLVAGSAHNLWGFFAAARDRRGSTQTP